MSERQDDHRGLIDGAAGRRLFMGRGVMNRRRFVVQAGSLAAISRSGMEAISSEQNHAAERSAEPQIKTGEHAWSLANGLIEKKLSWNGQCLYGHLGLPGEEPDWTRSISEPYIFLDGRQWAKDQHSLRLIASRPEQRDGIASLELTLGTTTLELLATLRYVCRRDDPAIEETCFLLNKGTKAISSLRRFDSCYFSIPVTAAASPRIPEERRKSVVAHWVEGVHDDQKLVDEVYRTYRVCSRSLSPGETLELESGRWSSNEKQPAVVIEVNGRSYFAGLGWSGEWNLHVEHRGNSVLAQAGLSDAELSISPDQRLDSPTSFYGVVAGGSEDAWNSIHKHCRASIQPSSRPDFPWVTYNTWYNFGIKLEESGLREEAQRAAALGIEVFYIDDGWFEGSDWTGKWGMGAGNWVENKRKFPSGVAAFAKHVHDLGMKFGLWVEPERLDIRYVDHPGLPTHESLATRQGQLIRWGFNTNDHEQPAYQVCFGDPAAQAQAIESLSRMVHEYGVDWLKWDHNRYEICQDGRHGHAAGEGDWAHTRGVYRVMSELRRRFPQLVIENCAAGGHRFDYGMMRYSDVTWTSDQTSPSFVSRHHVFGGSHTYPAEYLTSWYVPSDEESEAGAWTDDQLNTRFRSHMLGAFGISAKLGDWRLNVKNAARRSVELYKRLRRYFKGERFWLTEQATLLSPELAPAPTWDAVQMRLPDSDESVLLAFRSAAQEKAIVLHPRSLRREQTYQVRDEDGRMSMQPISGHVLMTAGLRIEVPEVHTSAVVYISPLRKS